MREHFRNFILNLLSFKMVLLNMLSREFNVSSEMEFKNERDVYVKNLSKQGGDIWY